MTTRGESSPTAAAPADSRLSAPGSTSSTPAGAAGGRVSKPGVYQLSSEAYHSDSLTPEPALSSGGARTIISACPAIFWEQRNNPPPPSEAFDIGDAAHEWLLEGDRWPQRHFLLPDDFDGRTKDGKALKAEAEAQGRRPLKTGVFKTIKAMVEALHRHPFAMQAFTGGQSEQSLYWQDNDFGIWRRARPDYMNELVSDYKTCRCAEPGHLQRAMYDYGYHQQAEWYLDGVKSLGLLDNPQFLFVFQEKTPPYLVTCVTPDQVAMDWAHVLNRKAREVFAKCLRENKWPGYSDKIEVLGLPDWAHHKLAERQQMGEFEVAFRFQSTGAANEVAL